MSPVAAAERLQRQRSRRVLYALAGGIVTGIGSWLLLQQLALARVSDRQLYLLSQSATSAAELSSTIRANLQTRAIELDLPSRGPDCDADLQRTLHLTQLSITAVRGAMRVQNGVVTCSSTNALPAGTRLPEPMLNHADGLHAWHRVMLPGMESVGPYVVLERHQLAVLVLPQEQFIPFFPAGTPVAVYTTQPPHSAALLTPGVSPGLLTALPPGVELLGERDRNTGDLVARRLTPSGQAIVMGTLPASQLQAMATAQFATWQWLSPVLGLLCMLFLLWRMRPGYRSARRELLHAVENQQLFLLYQPVIDLQTGRCTGAEALLRWRQNDGAILGPDAFVPLAEQLGLSYRLTERVCQVIARELPPVLAASPHFRIALNISPQELNGPQIVALLRNLRSHLRLAPSQLVVELTEGSLADVESALPTINQLRANGMAVAIDDFGTGYCSLSYLATYPFDILKIDRSFISAAGTDSVIGPIAEHIVTLSKSMGVQSLAEGVETAEQAERFRQQGVHYAQGYYFGAPMPMSQILQLLSADPAT